MGFMGFTGFIGIRVGGSGVLISPIACLLITYLGDLGGL